MNNTPPPAQATGPGPLDRRPDPAPGPAPPAEPFRPPAVLANPHIQTLLASVAVREPWIRRREHGLRQANRTMLVEAGDGVRLLGHFSGHGDGASEDRPLAVLIHGWLGCHDSRYLRSCAALLFDAGFNVLRLNLRDHGGSEALNPGLFHSCRIDEVVTAIGALQTRLPASFRLLGGFSLGANFALRVAARTATAGLELAAVVAVCPVLDPAATLRALEDGPAVYRQYFLQRWRRALRAKREAFPQRYADMRISRRDTLASLTDQLARRYAGFPDLRSYLDGYAVVDEALRDIEVPTHLIFAEDDPINPVADLDRLARPAALRIERLPRGGHCGFIDRIHGPSWADRRMLALFAAAGGRR